MARYAMVIDTRKCTGCQSCTVACRVNNELPIDMIYNPVMTHGPLGKFPHVRMVHIPSLCMHCGNSPCVDACPTGASQQREDGIVWVEENKCVGCKACVMACPYGARVSNGAKGTVQKCNFCKDDRVDQGKVPWCVQTCHQKARIFGDIEDQDSEVFKLVNKTKTTGRLLEELGTEPFVYYLY
ncbi:4Fe-4S dicluster domain-containing protein [Desulfitobacterium hafniense]|uniref:4Fe-4S ferredoxin n=4 Tax=root TaxID=1 RepID=A0A0W1JJH4_DESHA|nr:4Fe-4S dicluster domain-containing protein [Desulfitobacterium hafniense]ACL19928.1 4Fe-4S ferredoxin iron-sulfur binding domain protein [Desulfitobacterium hafniense DCB-2]KTE91502.1 4Fe-4S ferredoxin [Desulfitobacterium hafniense]BAE85310.1 putative oxidoreductase iron-sulfur subunit [Desulfitobacterium hafniense Y51]